MDEQKKEPLPPGLQALADMASKLVTRQMNKDWNVEVERLLEAINKHMYDKG